MNRSIEALLPVLSCVRCGGVDWRTAESADRAALICRGCGAQAQIRDGVLWIDSDVDPETRLERASVSATETNPTLGGWTETLAQAAAGLREAYLSLPYGDGSFRFDSPGYFANVRRFAEEFDFIVSELRTRVAAGRLLDLGADGTWSTARLAAAGFACVALDITDHLRVAHLYHAVGPPYALVNADMHARAFRDASFSAITAFNVLHHSSRLPSLVSNIARMLRPGGVVGIVEPYVQSAEHERVFGAEQSASGINEHVHALDHWQRTFSDAGLALAVYSLSDSFNAVFVKEEAGKPMQRTARHFSGGLPDAFYAAELSVVELTVSGVPARCRVVLSIDNRGEAAWASRGPRPVFVGYHVAFRPTSGEPVHRFDNPRAALPGFLAPGASHTAVIEIECAAAGTYDVEFDLVHETLTWFKDRGGRVATAHFVVELAR